MDKINVYESFTQTLLFSGALSVPKYLLANYAELGLSSQEFVLILHLLNSIDENAYPTAQELSERMQIPVSEAETSLANLLERKYLSIEKRWNNQTKRWGSAYSILGLINELAERWAIESFRQLENERIQSQVGRAEQEKPVDVHPQMRQLVKIYENELGRPLTGMECEFIERWLASGFAHDLIVEALRRGVGAGIRNFRYLDSIIREWEKKGLRTLPEIEAEDASFQERQEKKVRTAGGKRKRVASSKYDNFDL
ncbi:MAG: DnaD domain protein [Peptococcaceae bacterium]|jgi:DNA replication protein|nr:DnaD domain protein [Peptococcaceae bacterium]